MKRVTIASIALIILLSIHFSSCCRQSCAAKTETNKQQISVDYEKQGFTKATVVQLQLDGCSYVLQLESGKKLEPVNLSAELKKDKMNVWVKYKPKPDVASICMAGEVVEITTIAIRK